ncbi:MAG TPA: acyl-[acyl-carrier-protein] thioesterase [Methylomirabilota bacterium]|nr:acyl-[acyl-carrier-protein] thioesterase [Methylomirabilota bacterium]
MDAWLETYRGVVYRWEVDHNDHLTVAYYFARLGDATLALLDALGLPPESNGQSWVTADCHVRYVRELRAGDIIHVSSALIAVEPDGLVAGHKLTDTGTGEVVTTFEQRLRLTGRDGAPASLAAADRERLHARRADWDGPARERRARPKSLDGLRESARDTIRPWEAGGSLPGALAAYVHRFSAANSHVAAAFGLTPGYMRQHRRGFSTFEFQFGAARALTRGTLVTVRSAVTHVGTSSLRFFHVMSDTRTGAELATLHQSGVHFDQDARRPAPLPAGLASRARALLVPAEL